MNSLRHYLSEEGKSLGVLLVIALLFGLSLAYTSVQTFDPDEPLGYSDTRDYLEMYWGRSGSQIRGYRALVPFLARVLRVLPAPDSVFRSLRGSESIALWHFAIVNLLFLALFSLAFYYLQRDLGFGQLQAIGGVVLFFGCTYVVRAITLPMTEAAFYCFFVICLIGIRRGNAWLLGITFALGMCAKELMVLVVPFILLTKLSWRERVGLFLSLVPGAIAYLGLRMVITPSIPDPYGSGRFLLTTVDYLVEVARLNTLVQLFLAFSLLWVPAMYAVARCSVPADLRRWLWFYPLVLVGLIVNGACNFGRSSFIAFPVIIPLAVIGLSQWIGEGGVCERQQATFVDDNVSIREDPSA
jgi:hypothetical protein